MILFSLMMLVCLIIPIILFSLSYIIYLKMLLNYQKLSPFECGFDNMNSARIPFSTRFFLLGVIFIIFDIEIVLLLPIPLLNLMNTSIMIVMLIMLLLFIGLLHEWNEGSLDWLS